MPRRYCDSGNENEGIRVKPGLARFSNLVTKQEAVQLHRPIPMTTTSALPKDAGYEPDWRVVYYELDLEAIGPAWDVQVAAALGFQDAHRQLSDRTC